MTEEMNAVANEILDVSRNRLFVNLRFLDVALSYHKRKEYSGSISTDGSVIYYDSRYVINTFKSSESLMTRSYLHLIMHCIFIHPFVGPGIERRYWDLACDIAVENSINELSIKSLQSSRENQQLLVINEIRKDFKVMTAEKIYIWLKNNEYSERAIAKWEQLLALDNHDVWYVWGISSSNKGEEESGGRPIQTLAESVGMASSLRTEARRFWEQRAEGILVDLGSYSKSRGDMAGSLIQNLQEVTRERYDYTDFLKRFAVMGEAITVNEDEFDYVYYTYGLNRYGNMPLIEPLEYKEVKRIKDFVIAIDTSGSVMGAEVQSFLQKTYNILKQEESFFSRINIHIIQCDAEIQNDYVIHTQEDFDEYIRTMDIHGLGGTDFRPVFDYVNHLVEEKQLVNLKGILFFTDGYGVFPDYKPDYLTAFIFVRNNYEVPEVPAWAIKLVLQREELIDNGAGI